MLYSGYNLLSSIVQKYYILGILPKFSCNFSLILSEIQAQSTAYAPGIGTLYKAAAYGGEIEGIVLGVGDIGAPEHNRAQAVFESDRGVQCGVERLTHSVCVVPPDVSGSTGIGVYGGGHAQECPGKEIVGGGEESVRGCVRQALAL